MKLRPSPKDDFDYRERTGTPRKISVEVRKAAQVAPNGSEGLHFKRESMGNAGGKGYEEGPKAVEIAGRRRRMMEQVERFVVNVYASCSRVEAMWLILSSKLGQKAFETFVRLEESDALLSIFLANSDVLSSELSWDAALAHVQLLQPQLTDPDSPVADLLPELFRNEFLEDFATMEGAGNPKLLIALLQRLQNELVLIMARDLFNRFIMSKHYKTWRAAEASHAIATTIDDTSLSHVDDFAQSTNSSPQQVSAAASKSRHGSRNAQSRSSILRRSMSRLTAVTRMSQGAMLRFRMRSVVRPLDLSTSAFSLIKGDELQALLRRRENWVAALVAAVEALPVAFCLASCQRTSRPLIFVNKFFEKTTAFNREDVMGRSLGDLLLLNSASALHRSASTGDTNFVDVKDSEDRRVRQLREALQHCRSCVTVLDNKTADERDFKCLSVLKPVYSVDLDEHKLFCGADNNLNLALLTNNAHNLDSSGAHPVEPSSATSAGLQPLYIMALIFDVSREVDNFVSKSSLASDLMALLPDVLLRGEEDDEDDGLFGASDGAASLSGGSKGPASFADSAKSSSSAKSSKSFCVIS